MAWEELTPLVGWWPIRKETLTKDLVGAWTKAMNLDRFDLA
jgi:catalase (peroxidase I)